MAEAGRAQMNETVAPKRKSPSRVSEVEWRRGLGIVIERFPLRLRDRRFWITQALVIGISAAHTGLEATKHLGVLPDLALLPVSTYFIPVVYAALNFGVEGAVPTALWCALLSLPNVILWHTTSQRPGVLLQLALLVVLAYVIARRVDVETEAKERAQSANARLARVNSTAAASARSLDLDVVISETMQAMLDPAKRQTGWILLAARNGRPESVTIGSSSPEAGEPGERELALSRSLFGDRNADRDSIRGENLAVVPLRVADQVVGAVGVASNDEQLSDDDIKLLEAVGNQLSVAFGNIRHLRQAETMVSELSRAQSALEEYVRLATEAQEEERKRLARELHDDTIQTLVVAKTELDTLASEGLRHDVVQERLRRVEQMLASAIDSVRRFSRDLRPSLLDDLGLVHAIDWLAADLGRRTGITAQLRIRGTTRRLRPQVELALFRIIQEALHNVERHSAASAVRVRIAFSDAHVSVKIIDNGCGFEPRALLDNNDPSLKLGLLGMRERAKLAGAEIAIRSRPGAGTRITVTLQTTP
jgi:signal transduction histidine kinase